MRRDPYRYFRPEARELLEQLNQGVLDLERGGIEVVPRLLRLAHTLKGAARVVRQGAIADHAHAIEGTLAALRDSPSERRPERIDALLTTLDAMARLVSDLSAPAPPEDARTVDAPGDDGFKTIRANVAEMDALLDGVAESHVQLNTLRQAVASLDRGSHLAALLVDQLSPRAGRPVADAAAGVTAGELRQLLAGLERQVHSGIDQLQRELRQVREAAEQLRLIPAGVMFTSLERTVRDAARALGKAARFEARGSDVRVESQVVTTVEGALVQLTRNAVAHGIESERERAAAGKPPAGCVAVEVVRRGRHVVFRCADDGRGIDLEQVRRIAARAGVPSVEFATLGAQDLMRMLLRGGISTAPSVTEVAGRGIGLDVVRNAAELLKGDVNVVTEPGRGATFEIVVPLALTALDAIIVEAHGLAAAIPLDSVRKAVRVGAGDFSRTARDEAVVYDGRAIPFVALTRALQAASGRSRASRVTSAIVIEGAQGLAAVGVDRVLGTAGIVVRPLPDLVQAAPVVGGAYLDGEGNPQLVLDADGLVAEARREGAIELDSEPARPSLLVIDDSLTTRMLEKSILESAGFDVDTVVSAEEALQSAHRKSYALFLVDIEMPGMDGFTFVERIRAEPALRDVPAILVTSRSSPEDRLRGDRVGAQGYMVKSEFNQAELLGRINQLVATGSG